MLTAKIQFGLSLIFDNKRRASGVFPKIHGQTFHKAKDRNHQTHMEMDV